MDINKLKMTLEEQQRFKEEASVVRRLQGIPEPKQLIDIVQDQATRQVEALNKIMEPYLKLRVGSKVKLSRKDIHICSVISTPGNSAEAYDSVPDEFEGIVDNIIDKEYVNVWADLEIAGSISLVHIKIKKEFLTKI